MERYYIIGNDGNVWGEADTLRMAEAILDSLPDEDRETYELEIITEQQ